MNFAYSLFLFLSFLQPLDSDSYSIREGARLKLIADCPGFMICVLYHFPKSAEVETVLLQIMTSYSLTPESYKSLCTWNDIIENPRKYKIYKSIDPFFYQTLDQLIRVCITKRLFTESEMESYRFQKDVLPLHWYGEPAGVVYIMQTRRKVQKALPYFYLPKEN